MPEVEKKKTQERERERPWSEVPLPHTALLGRSPTGSPTLRAAVLVQRKERILLHIGSLTAVAGGKGWTEWEGSRQGDRFVILTKMDDLYSTIPAVKVPARFLLQDSLMQN